MKEHWWKFKIYKITYSKLQSIPKYILSAENARVKLVLKSNEYQHSIISKIFKRITNNHNLSNSQTQATNIQGKQIRMSINLWYIEGTSEKLWHILTSDKIRSIILKTLCVNYFVNRKITWPQKIKIILFMKLTAVTGKRSTSVNLNGLSNHIQMKIKELSGIVILKKKLQSTVGKQITIFAGIRKKLLIRKSG